MEKLLLEDCKRFIIKASALMDKNKWSLIDLDSKMGDGDLGLTMSLGFGKAKEFTLAFEDPEIEDIGLFFYQVGKTINKAVPSTMGTLIASAFIRAGKELKGKTELLTPDFTTFCKAFASGIMDRGKAKPGERTIVDVLCPAYEAALKASEENASLDMAIAKAYEASLEGLEATKNMAPTTGKAFYHQEKCVGVQDQGATVGMLIFKAWNEL